MTPHSEAKRLKVIPVMTDTLFAIALRHLQILPFFSPSAFVKPAEGF